MTKVIDDCLNKLLPGGICNLIVGYYREYTFLKELSSLERKNTYEHVIDFEQVFEFLTVFDETGRSPFGIDEYSPVRMKNDNRKVNCSFDDGRFVSGYYSCKTCGIWHYLTPRVFYPNDCDPVLYT